VKNAKIPNGSSLLEPRSNFILPKLDVGYRLSEEANEDDHADDCFDLLFADTQNST
jgi:hypothetical protein